MSDYVYKLATEADKQRIIDYLCIWFQKDEPMIRSLQLSADQTRCVYEEIADRSLKSPFSTIVTQGDGVVGVLLNSVWRRKDGLETADFSYDNDGASVIARILNMAHSTFWEVAPPDVEAVIHREISSVATPHQRRGIATRLVTSNLSRKALEALEIGGIISETSSFANQTLLEKQGFKCLHTVPYSSIRDSEGRQMIRTDDGSTGVRLNFKLIADFHDLPP